jgi:hypothetical protein
MVLHVDSPAGYDEIAYDSQRGWGFEEIYPDLDGPYTDPDRNTAGRFGPFDSSPNGRTKWADTLPDQLYDSFIGMKDFAQACNASFFPDAEDPLNEPCSSDIDPDGGIFRIDVPNGMYRFVGVFGDADNVHAHRVLAEDGGSGPPADGIGENHVVLVHNHDQAQQIIGEAEPAEPGEGAYALVGFDDHLPPAPQGPGPIPRFVSMDENGFPILDDDGEPVEPPVPSSPVLEVTQGYIRIHLLQGNSNDGDGGPFDPNGGDIVLLEVYPVGGVLVGDFNANGALDVGDIDDLTAQSATATNPSAYDLNSDALVNEGDIAVWVKDLFNSWIGDANLDGEFNSSDLVGVLASGTYEVDVNAVWSTGDFNGDGRTNSADLVSALADGGYEAGPRAAVAAVPEPSSIALVWLSIVGLSSHIRRRWYPSHVTA